MLGNEHTPGKRLRIRLRDGSIQEIPASDSLPDGATLLAVHVPLFMKDAAMREFASFPRDSSSEEEKEAQREHERLLGQRQGAYMAMAADIASGWMNEEQRAASPKTIANPTREDVARAREDMCRSIAEAWQAPLTRRRT